MILTREVKLCLLGDAGVGKTSLLNRFVKGSWDPHTGTTIGAAFMTKTVIIDDNSFKYQIWDTSGQERYRSLAPMYYRNIAVAIVVYDVTRSNSFQSAKRWVEELRSRCSPNVVLALAGNKCDLQDSREVLFRDALRYAESIGALLVETSALRSTNIDSLFNAITKTLLSMRDKDGFVTLHRMQLDNEKILLEDSNECRHFYIGNCCKS